MIKYLGSKRLLAGRIVAAIAAVPEARTALDLFSGTARVGFALKDAGLHVTASDHNRYAYVLARGHVEADRALVEREATDLLRELSALPPRAGYFTETFCIRSRFFQPHNGARIDAMREALATWPLDPLLRDVALVALMEAADRVDSTTGVQMAYLKSWAPRAHHHLELRLPAMLPGPGRALCLDARAAAVTVAADVAYLDPPYNQHSYLGNYHIWETLARWDRPLVYGVACKRVDCREVRSPFNSRRAIHGALRDVIGAVRAPHLVVSFSNEGYVPRAEMEALLRGRGHVEVLAIDFKRYVGAQIGIHNPKGERVGRVSHLRNQEFLFFVSPDRAVARRMRLAAESPAAAPMGRRLVPSAPRRALPAVARR